MASISEIPHLLPFIGLFLSGLLPLAAVALYGLTLKPTRLKHDKHPVNRVLRRLDGHFETTLAMGPKSPWATELVDLALHLFVPANACLAIWRYRDSLGGKLELAPLYSFATCVMVTIAGAMFGYYAEVARGNHQRKLAKAAQTARGRA